MTKDRIATLCQTILGSDSGIEDELNRTDNSWAACYATRVIAVSLQLEMIKRLGSLSGDRITALSEKIDRLFVLARELRSEYPFRENEPPEAVRSAAIAEIRALADDLGPSAEARVPSWR